MFISPQYDKDNNLIEKAITFGPGFTGIDEGFIGIRSDNDEIDGIGCFIAYSLDLDSPEDMFAVTLPELEVVCNDIIEQELHESGVDQFIAFVIKNMDALLFYWDRGYIENITPVQLLDMLTPLTDSEKDIASYISPQSF